MYSGLVGGVRPHSGHGAGREMPMPVLAAGIGPLGVPELLIILAIVALLFGASRVGDLGRSLGRGIREFKSEVRKAEDEETPPVASTDATPGASTSAKNSE